MPKQYRLVRKLHGRYQHTAAREMSSSTTSHPQIQISDTEMLRRAAQRDILSRRSISKVTSNLLIVVYLVFYASSDQYERLIATDTKVFSCARRIRLLGATLLCGLYRPTRLLPADTKVESLIRGLVFVEKAHVAAQKPVAQSHHHQGRWIIHNRSICHVYIPGTFFADAIDPKCLLDHRRLHIFTDSPAR